MSPVVQNNAAPGLAPLVGGIVQDAQELLRQQLTLFQVEIKNDLRRTRDAAVPMIVGGVVAHVALVVLCAALALALNQLYQFPTWGGFVIVGGAVLVIGGVLVFWGKKQFDAFNPLPDKSVEALKETIQWKTKT